MRPASGRTLYRRSLRGRDWLGIVLIMVPLALYLVGALFGERDLSSPHVSWNVTQLVAVVIHVPLWVAAVVLFLSGKMLRREPSSQAGDEDGEQP